MKKVILFGASRLGEIAYNILKDKFNIVFFVDNDKTKWDTYFCGKLIIAPEEIKNNHFDFILIASSYYCEISNQLKDIAIEDVYVFSYCDVDDTTYKKRYSIDKVCDINNYICQKNNDSFRDRKFVNDFSLLYNNEKYNDNTYVDKHSLGDVLIFAYIFPPIGGGGVQRTLKLVKYLKKFNYNPIVVTVGEHFFYDSEDQSLLNEIDNDIKIIRINHKKVNSEQLTAVEITQIIALISGIINDEELTKKFIDKLIDNRCGNRNYIMIPDKYITWVNDVLKQIEKEVDISKIEYIYTTSFPYSTHILGYYLKNKYKKKWIMDFRDEWTHHPYFFNTYKRENFKYQMECKLEGQLIKNANKIVVATPTMKENYIKNFKLNTRMIYVMTNGYDEEDYVNLKESSRNSKFTIVFSGSMYKQIRPTSLVTAINDMVDNGQIDKEKIIFNIYGRINLEIIDEIRNIDKYGIVKFNGYVAHDLCLQACKDADLLFVVLGKSEEVKSVYGGKIFEYLRLCRPILSLSPSNSILEQLINDVGVGRNIEYDDVKEIQNYLKKIYDNWNNKKENTNYNLKKIREFSRENIVLNFINNLMN